MLPFSYNETRCVLLPVDPGTAFAYWDYSSDTWSELEKEDSSLELALESKESEPLRFETSKNVKSYYFRGLSPRKSYRLVITATGKNGSRRIMSSQEIAIPPSDISLNNSVLFARLPLNEPLALAGRRSRRSKYCTNEPEIASDSFPFETYVPSGKKSYLAGYSQSSSVPLGYGKSIPWAQPEAEENEEE